MPDTCLVCKKTVKTGPGVSLHRFPPKSDAARRQQWLGALGLQEDTVREHYRVCSCHFPSGDASQTPSLNLGKRFASPKKMTTPRGNRAAKRKSLYPLPSSTPKRPSATSSPSVSPATSPPLLLPQVNVMTMILSRQLLCLLLWEKYYCLTIAFMSCQT